MTDKMKDFIKKLEKVRNGEDEGLVCLKEVGIKLDTVTCTCYGNVYLTYSPILKLGRLKFRTGCKNKIYCGDDNKLFYIQQKRFREFKYTNEPTVLEDGFDVCIVHNMKRVNIGNFDEFEVLVESSIDVFLITNYGCIDLYNDITTNLSIETAIEDLFKNESIFLHPSNKSVFARDLNKEVSQLLTKEEETISTHKFKMSLECDICGNTFYDPNIKYATSVYINNKCFGEFKCNYLNEAKIKIKNNFTKDIVFSSLISVYGLRTKISSKLLAKSNEWFFVDDMDLSTNIPKFNSSLLRCISFYNVKNGIDDIKNKYYCDLVCSTKDIKIKGIISEQFINYKLNFKERIGNEFAYGKLLFLNSEFVDKSNNIYAVSLYRQYIISCNNKIYKVNEILVENKLENKIFLMSLLEIGAQVKLTKDNVSLPILYFIPYNIMIGLEVDNIIKNSLVSKLIIDKGVKKYVCDKLVKDFGNIFLCDNIFSKCIMNKSDTFIDNANKSFEKISNISISSDLEDDIIQFMKEVI